MKTLAVFVLAISLTISTSASKPHPVPKDRASLANGDWFPFIVSKVGPLEWWYFASSLDDLRRDDFPSDWHYDFARKNTWEYPRFCFSMFRPKPEDYHSLYTAVEQYQGDVAWQMHDGCISASTARGTFYSAVDPQLAEKLIAAAKNPPKPDPEFVKRAMADLPKLCAFLESRLDLKLREPIDFQPQWVTKEGLESSRGEFEDFLEPGAWTVILASDPHKAASVDASSTKAQALSFGLGDSEFDTLFRELGADWKRYDSLGRNEPILSKYPLLSRLDDITSDAIYEPEEIDLFLAELNQAQVVVKDPRSIRGLDKLVRIVRWAHKLNCGIYFGGE